MTASQIRQAAHVFAPRLQLRDVWLIMGELQQRNLAYCLNPEHATGKLFFFTSRGRDLVALAFALPISLPGEPVDWRRYALVARAKLRQHVLLEIARVDRRDPFGKSVSRVRENLRNHLPVGHDLVLRKVSELRQLGLIRPSIRFERALRKQYRLTWAGRLIANELRRQPEFRSDS